MDQGHSLDILNSAGYTLVIKDSDSQYTSCLVDTITNIIYDNVVDINNEPSFNSFFDDKPLIGFLDTNNNGKFNVSPYFNVINSAPYINVIATKQPTCPSCSDGELKIQINNFQNVVNVNTLQYFDKNGNTIVPARLMKVISVRIQISRENPLKLFK